MRRNSNHIVFYILTAIIGMVAVDISPSFSQNEASVARTCYEVQSSTPGEIVLHIHPDFTTKTVTDPVTGEQYVAVDFSGSSTLTSLAGAPAERPLDLRVLIGSEQTPASVRIVSSETKTISGVLAPYPTLRVRNGVVEEKYIRDAEKYGSHISGSVVSVLPPRVLRSAFVNDLVFHPVSYDLERGITLVTDLVVRIAIPYGDSPAAKNVSGQEQEFFRSMCLNGENTTLYRSATTELSKGLQFLQRSYKAASVTSEQWFVITTADEGIYHITASDLSKAGGAAIDPSTIALYGYGAGTIPESIDSLTGELRECAIDVKTNSDGSFSEIRFFAQGPAEWYYDQNNTATPIFGMYHLMNPYTTAGHFLLKIGGSPAAKRIATTPDVIADSIVRFRRSSVETVALHEAELKSEDRNISREWVGETIPLGRDVTIGLPDLPGYTGDSTVVRPAFNSRATTKRHYFNISINGTAFPRIIDNGQLNSLDDGPYTTRNWGTEYLLPSGFGVPSSITVGALDTELSASFWLNFVEVFYRRQASLSNGQLPFVLFGDGSAYTYSLTNASGSEVWDVSSSLSAKRIAVASSDNVDVTVIGNARGLRRFVAFNPSQLKTATLVSTGAPSLRSGICSSGAQEIIITTQALLDQANHLAAQRQKGGQATGPITTAVVTIEDIYKEFGYGNNDGVSIRDFIKAAVRRSTVSGGTVPLYICLFSSGHVDYQNRSTTIPVGIPVYEWWTFYSAAELRSIEPLYESDDGFYAQLSASSQGIYKGVDIPIGRVTVLTPSEGDDFVSKVVTYETASDEGAWRSRAAFICDDRYYDNIEGPDPLNHFQDTENEVVETPDRLSFVKIYGQAYPNLFTATGRRKPEMEAAIVNAFNSGAAVISYVGHGNPTVWANEGILTVPSTINKFTNRTRLAYVTTATCDFSRYDDYSAKTSGGVQMLKSPDGGAIGLLATCRSVFGGDSFAPQFYLSLFKVPCAADLSTMPVGVSYVYARSVGYDANRDKYFILGDPAQRLLIPRQFMVIDSINGIPYSEAASAPHRIEALSLLTIAGHVSNTCDGSDIDATFNGSMNITLYDTPSSVSVTTTFSAAAPITDTWQVDGPVLYSGASNVTAGRFNTTFVVSKDIKFDTAHARISMLAYSDNVRSALGVAKNIQVFGIDTTRINADHQGPQLSIYIGTRAFHSGDVVPANSVLIVDVNDASGLNTSTSGIGHSFTGWTDDSTSGMIDLSANYIAQPNDFTRGTSTQQVALPLGKHTMNVRAFDAAGNPSFAQVEFVAQGSAPYKLYNVSVYPNPVRRHATFTLEQPGPPEYPVDVTLDLYSSIGAHMRTILAPSISSNVITIAFDGNDAAGNEMLDGMYLYRVSTVQKLSGEQTTSAGTFIIMHDQ